MWVYAFGLCLATLALYIDRLFRKSVSLPPGPPGWPLIGNLLDFPTYAPYKVFGAMGRKHGPIISLNVMGKRYLVLNSFKATKDILDNKSAITSDRLQLRMAGELVGWDNITPLLQYNDTCQKHRKFFHRQIGTKSSLQAFDSIQEAEAKQLACDLLEKPNEVVLCCRKTAVSIILRITHGYSIKGGDDPLVEIADKAMQNFADVTTPGRYLVDMIPILRFLPEWFPGAGFLTDAKRWQKMLRDTATIPFDFVLENLANNDAAPSFASRLLQEGVTPEDQDVLKWASFSMYLGGSDTTPSIVSAFFLAMTMYPEILQKAQAEVDVIVGSQRLPTIQDRETLPYVNAICKELLRWNVVGAMAIHVTSKDFMYEGNLIPKGTSVVGNIWFILSDPETYPNPDVFDPERYLGDNQQPDPRDVCFGWGRRVCPGSHLAESTIFICIAVAIATLNISRCVRNGVEHVPKYDVREGIVRQMKPFKCQIAARSKKAEELLYA